MKTPKTAAPEAPVMLAKIPNTKADRFIREEANA